jgi:hypothetical protein
MSLKNIFKNSWMGFQVALNVNDNLNGSVGSIADLKPKGPGFESRISQGFFLM